MKAHLCFMLLAYCTGNYVYGTQQQTIFTCSVASFTALRYILQELAGETDDDVPAPSKPNIFNQFTSFMDSHFDKIKTDNASHIAFDYNKGLNFFLLASLLHQPHELWHALQQRTSRADIPYKRRVKSVVEKFYDAISLPSFQATHPSMKIVHVRNAIFPQISPPGALC